MKKITISLLVIVSAFIMTSCTKDQQINVSNEINAKVDGYIFDEKTNLPIEGAKVTISNKTATTNTNGYYYIEGLSSGNYPVKLEKEGYATTLSYGLSIDGTNFYGDAIQSCAALNMYPKTEDLEITLRHFDGTDWFNAPAGIKVTVTYTNSDVLDVFPEYTTNSSGKITISNVAALQNIKLVIDQKLGDNIYELNETLTPSQMANFDNNIRIEISKTDAPAPGDIDILN